MFTEIYLRTTNPNFSFYEMSDPVLLYGLLISIITHSIIYIIFIILL